MEIRRLNSIVIVDLCEDSVAEFWSCLHCCMLSMLKVALTVPHTDYQLMVAALLAIDDQAKYKV